MSAGRNKLIFFLAVAFVAGFAMTEKANSVQLESLPLEEAAYYRVIGGANPAGKNWKAEYIKKLSPGGKAYFLACRRDYKEALLALEKVPKRDTGSYFYVKAFCLEGLGRHAEALKFFDTAKAKINDDFNPGFRFYLQCATAHMRVGNEKKSLADLDTAGPISEEYAQVTAYPRYVRAEISKRKIAVVEYKGRYKEAFVKYMALFNQVNDQFRLHESLFGDAQSRAQAEKWLAEHGVPPPFKTETERCIYYLTKGKADMVLGKFASAKINLMEATGRLSRDRNGESSRTKYEDTTVLLRIRDQAKTLLVKIYFKENDFPKCCEHIRTLFSNEVMKSLDTTYNIIPMHDVTELVTKKDMDLHDDSLELRLDKTDLIQDELTGRESKTPIKRPAR